MNRFRRLVPVFVLLFAWSLGPASVQAQAGRFRVDGVSLGIGLNLYQGDLDANSNSNLIKFVGASNLNALASVDRQFGAFAGALTLQYNRFFIDLGGVRGRPEVSMANNLFNLDAEAIYRLNLIRPGLLSVFVGAGPMLLLPRYYTFPEEARGYEARGTRLLPTLSAGLIIQHRVRLGTRVAPTDYLEGVSLSQNRDYLSFINIAYRFRLD